MRNETLHKSSSRSRRYDGIRTMRAIVLGLVVTPIIIIAGLMYFGLPGGKPQGQLSDWGTTPAFALSATPEELQKAFSDTHTALGTTHVERDQIVAKLETLKREYNSGFRSAASLDQAVNELLSSCDDRYIRLMTAQEYEDRLLRLSGKKIGIVLDFSYQSETESYVVNNVGPVAERTGIQKGDAFISIELNGEIYHKDFLEKNGLQGHQLVNALNEVIQKGGRIGSQLHLILRRGADVYDFYVERTVIGEEDSIVISDVTVNQHPQGPAVGKAKMMTIRFMDADNFMEKFQDKLKEVLATENLQGIGLDLSGAVGGNRDMAIQIAAMFINSGTITHEIRPAGADGVEMATYFVKDGKVFVTVQGPFTKDSTGKLVGGSFNVTTTDTGWQAGLFKGHVVVAIGENTMGSAELIASAIQGSRNGVVVGQSLTFGKGMGQTLMPILPDRIVSYSTSVFLQPDGTSLEQTGVRPNIGLQGVAAGQIQQVMQRQFTIVPYPTQPRVFVK